MYLDSPPSSQSTNEAQRQGLGRPKTRPWSPVVQNSTAGSSSTDSRALLAHFQRDHRRNLERAGNDYDYDYDPYSPLEMPGQLHRFSEEYPPLPESQFPRLPATTRRRERREASDASVEALDLADYARTLRARQAEDPYPPLPFTNASLNSSSRESHQHQQQRGGGRGSRPTLGPYSHPPSSFPARTPRDEYPSWSSMDTLTTQVDRAQSSSSTSSQAPRRTRRPYSLPASRYGSTPQVVTPPPNPDDEIDISQFPPWSRGWYKSSGGNAKNNNNNNAQGARQTGQKDVLDPLEEYEREAGHAIPPSLLRNHRDSGRGGKPISPFDPGYIHPQSYPRGSGADLYDDITSAPSYSSHGYNQAREGVVPWSHDPPEYGNPPLDPHVKEERMRMLQREFGSNSKNGKGAGNHYSDYKGYKGKEKERDDGLLRDEDGNVVVGTPDGKGGLATEGPKKRVLVRVLQVALAVAVGAPVVWAGITLKPNPAPPPSGKPPLYILYILSPITLLLLLYLFCVRPCTVRRRYSSASSLTSPSPLGYPAAQGMMVLPVPSGGQNLKGKPPKGQKGMKGWEKGKGKKKGKGQPPQSDVQVNLIVDPNAFMLPGEDSSSDDEEDEGEYDDGGMPGGFNPYNPPSHKTQERDRAKQKQKRKRKRNRRRTLLASLRLEEAWVEARSWAKKIALVDGLGCLVWAVVFGFVMAGERCVGGKEKGVGGKEKGGGKEEYGPWCAAYNASTAAACLLSVAFGVSVFFGVKDLYASKMSPRTRV